MPHSLSQIYIHIIFSTKHGMHPMPFIDNGIGDERYAYLGGTCKSLDCPPIKVGGYRDHILILCKFSKKILLISLLEEVKKSSGKWVKTKGNQYMNFCCRDACLHVAVPAKAEFNKSV